MADMNGTGRTSFWLHSLALLSVWVIGVALRSAETVADTLMASALIPNIAQGYGIDLSRAQVGIDLIREQSAYYWIHPRYGLVGIYPIGMVLLAAPIQGLLWLLAHCLGVETSVLSPTFPGARFILEKMTASFLVAISVMYVYRSLKLVVGRRYAFPLTALYLFGSSSLSLLAQGLWQQTGINLLTLFLFHFLLQKRDKISRSQEILFFGLAGFLFSIRPTAALWSVIFVFSFCRTFGRPRLVSLFAAALGVMPALAWNMEIFGHPLGGYALTPVATFDSQPMACLTRLFQILFSPTKGALVFNPLLIGLIFYGSACRGVETKSRAICHALLVGLVCHLLLCSTNPSWHGGRGFGPRYMLDGLGVAFVLSGLGIAYISERLPRATTATIGLVGIYSIALHIFGAIGAKLGAASLVSLHQRMLLP